MAASSAFTADHELIGANVVGGGMILHPDKLAVAVMKRCRVGGMNRSPVVRGDNRTAPLYKQLDKSGILLRDSKAISAAMDPEDTGLLFFRLILWLIDAQPKRLIVRCRDGDLAVL